MLTITNVKLRILAIAVMLTPLGFALPIEASQVLPSNTHSPLVLSQSDWQTYTRTGHFRVEMPGQPEEERSSEDFGGETLTIEEIQFEDEEGIYGVFYMELPTEYLQQASDKQILDEMSDSFLEGMEMPDLKSQEQLIDLNGYPGREYRVTEIEGEGLLVLRLYLAENKIYFLVSASSVADLVERFMNSFELL
ncbi:hypothetical protein PN466_04775 [Roseofilum reptotaenium CS-1145]|nr:hypothetical protein [Roseofilum reptotaenium]MDB9516273.1 hypothetical protein [Roseofilum reptotaenium CS-1145]